MRRKNTRKLRESERLQRKRKGVDAQDREYNRYSSTAIPGVPRTSCPSRAAVYVGLAPVAKTETIIAC